MDQKTIFVVSLWLFVLFVFQMIAFTSRDRPETCDHTSHPDLAMELSTVDCEL